MITSIDLYNSLKLVLTKYFPDVVIRENNSVAPEVPYFCVKFINKNSKQAAVNFKTDKYCFEVLFFHSENEVHNILSKEVILEMIFKKPLFVGGNWIEIDETNITLDEVNVLKLALGMEITQRLTNLIDGEDIVVDMENRFDSENYNVEKLNEMEI